MNFREEEHPRDSDGKFTDGLGIPKMQKSTSLLDGKGESKYSDRFRQYDHIDDLENYYIKNCGNMTTNEMDAVEAALEHRNYTKIVPNVDEWADNLNQDELNAIKFYCGRNSYNLNSNIRNGMIAGMRDDYKQVMNNLDCAINSFELQKPIKVYRGIRTEALEKMLGKSIVDDFGRINDFSGCKFIDKAFVSCSVSPQAVKDYINSTIHTENESVVSLQIDLPKGKGIGAPIDSISFIPQEQEFLLARNLPLEIVDIVGDKGHYKVRCRYANNN